MRDYANGAIAGVFFAAGLVLFFTALEGFLTPDLNTVTIHKTTDRLPVACQEGGQ